MAKLIIVINGATLTEAEVSTLINLVEAGFDSQCDDWDEVETTQARALLDKYFPN